MNGKIFKEKTFSLGITLILGIFAVAVTTFAIVNQVAGPLGSKPAPPLLLWIFSGFFILVTINFMFLRVSITEAGISAGYGILGSTIPWDRIESVEKDTENRFFGWGIRIGYYKKKRIWVYNTIGGDRVVFMTKDNKPTSIMVSSKNPEELINTAKTYGLND
ncbi:hypothetical protein KKF34_06260 [Myxococcota bacterium]|nr:hypothetical protein [Myxococcota bacterium]MBU1381778.1 hypothetical protein [Myxococcota bacterium]MBU1496462.1 hypothetical protein [Myxococcota bacterium]